MFKIDFSKWFIRVFALIIAVVLWYYVDTRERTSREIEARVTFLHIPVNLFTHFNFQRKVTFKVSGKKEIVNSINTRGFNCYVDFDLAKNKAAAGTKLYKIEIDNPDTGISVEIIGDTKIGIEFQKYATKDVEVKLDIKTKALRRNYKILRAEYSPKIVTISGPEKEIKAIKEIKTQKQTIEYKKDDLETTVAFEKLPDYIKIISDQYITYKAIVDVKVLKLRIENVKVIPVNNIFSPLSIVEKELKLDYIIYQGPAKYINKINRKDVRAYIDIGKVNKEGTHQVKVIIQKLKNIKVIGYKPKTIQITLKRTGF